MTYIVPAVMCSALLAGIYIGVYGIHSAVERLVDQMGKILEKLDETDPNPPQ